MYILSNYSINIYWVLLYKGLNPGPEKAGVMCHFHGFKRKTGTHKFIEGKHKFFPDESPDLNLRLFTIKLLNTFFNSLNSAD